MSLIQMQCDDSVILDQWHPIASQDEMQQGIVANTVLLEQPISYAMAGVGVGADSDFGSGNNSGANAVQFFVWLRNDRLRAGDRYDDEIEKISLPVMLKFGTLWTCLGTPPAELFDIAEFDEPDRQSVATGVFGVQVSAGRAVENFLDMGHFPYVHTGILGEEPHTEVKEYDVEVSAERDEVLATRCRFYQPQAAVASEGGADVDYIYRVPHINCALLYKSCPNDEHRFDVIYLFLQPMGPESIRAHSGMCVIDDQSGYETIRFFQQHIFGQDKPILENQFPKRLPLDTRAETPIRADKSAIAYRRWLSQKGLTYGVVPAG